MKHVTPLASIRSVKDSNFALKCFRVGDSGPFSVVPHFTATLILPYMSFTGHSYSPAFLFLVFCWPVFLLKRLNYFLCFVNTIFIGRRF